MTCDWDRSLEPSAAVTMLMPLGQGPTNRRDKSGMSWHDAVNGKFRFLWSSFSCKLQSLEHLMWKMESDEMNWSDFCTNLWTVCWTGSWLNATRPGRVATRREMRWQRCYNRQSSMVHPWCMHHTEKVRLPDIQWFLGGKLEVFHSSYNIWYCLSGPVFHPPRAGQFP